MKRILLAAMLVILAACGGDAEVANTAMQDGAVAAESPFPADAFFVDVRTPEEFATGHVEGAINIPHDQMEQRWEEIEEYRDRPVILYCQSGRRSGMALEVLQERGFDQAQNAGGLPDLVEMGVPTTE